MSLIYYNFGRSNSYHGVGVGNFFPWKSGSCWTCFPWILHKLALKTEHFLIMLCKWRYLTKKRVLHTFCASRKPWFLPTKKTEKREPCFLGSCSFSFLHFNRYMIGVCFMCFSSTIVLKYSFGMTSLPCMDLWWHVLCLCTFSSCPLVHFIKSTLW